MKYYKLDVAIKEALECSYKYGGIWCVIELKYGQFDIEKLSNIHKNEKIVYETGDMQKQ